jgi:hypothetical protein
LIAHPGTDLTVPWWKAIRKQTARTSCRCIGSMTVS